MAEDPLCRGSPDSPVFLLQVRRLKLQLEEERQKCSRSEGSAADMAGLHNGSDLQFIEMQSRYSGQASATPWGAASLTMHISLGKPRYKDCIVLRSPYSSRAHRIVLISVVLLGRAF